MPAAAFDETGRMTALRAYSADQERAPAGAANGGQWVADGSEPGGDADQATKEAFQAMLGMTPEQRQQFLAKMSPDQLSKLGALMGKSKSAKGPIADIRNAVGDSMVTRGLDPAKSGLKSSKAGAKKKAPAKKGGSGKSGGGSKGGGGKSSGGSSKKSSGGSKSSGSKSNGSKSSGSKSSGSKSSSPKAPAKPTKPPKPAPTPPPPPAVTQLPSTRPGGPIAGPPTTQTSRPARRLGKRRRPTGR